MSWCGWGRPELKTALPEAARALLEQALGIGRLDTPAVPLEAVRVGPSRLSEEARAALTAVVGAEHVLVDRDARIRHTRGRSTVDLLRLRGGDADSAPDAVVLPAGHEEVLAVLRACAAHAVAVVPFGGGTSVVGGLELLRDGLQAVISLDLRRLDAVVAVDPVSLTAALQPGLRAPRAEELLAAQGLTLGHFPQSFEHASIGGFAATRSAGQASSGYGRFDDMVLALRVATPEGSLELGRAPASAAGPDLRQLFVGSEGVLGVITELTLRVHRTPEVRLYEGWRFPSFESGITAVRRLVQEDASPTVIRLSDESETAVNRALESAAADGAEGGCDVIAGFEGSNATVTAARTLATAILTSKGGTPTGTEPGEAWLHARYRAPYLRDALLDVGVFAETLETATSWSKLAELHRQVRTALERELTWEGRPPLVLCHVSHVYPTGASLYFTVVAALAEDPIAQWSRAKQVASDAIVACGATITHHHAVGIDHRDWMTAEIGALGVEILRAVKQRVDPRGILNPGKLIPDPE
ncbi:MAG: FAD-binding oxidoreductase [Chloroflexi bacterium]|nr:MAG: FAD-binding oxidoreductase [Chloroflexota bacterium]